MAKNVVTFDLNNTDYSFRPYGVCNTTSTTAAKTVAISEFELCPGATVLIKFTESNNANNITLNVNGTGAMPVQGLSDVFYQGVYYEFLYDGTNWVEIGERHNHRCSSYTRNKNNYPYRRIASTNIVETTNLSQSTTLILKEPSIGGRYGELCINYYTASEGKTASYEIYWIIKKGFSDDQIQIGFFNTPGEVCMDVFYKNPSIWSALIVEQKMGGRKEGASHFDVNKGEFKFINSLEVYDTTETDKKTSSECYKTIADAAIELYGTGKAYSIITTPNDGTSAIGEISFNGNATSATTATKIKQTVTTSNASYPLLLAPSGQSATANSAATYFDSDVTLNPTSNILSGAKVYESLLQWGNTAIAGGLSPLDVAMDGQWSANRLSFMPADDIKIEYSTNGGTSWEDYGLTASEKQAFVTTGLSYSLYPGKNTTRQKINSDRVRVTITASSGKTYFKLKKIYMFMSREGADNCKFIVEKSYCGSDTTFTQVGKYDISGWSGWNSIPLTASFGGRDDQTTNIRKLRFTYYFEQYDQGLGYGATDGKAVISYISKLNMIGETFWSNSGGSLATTGHLYSWDVNKNAMFPANLISSGTSIANSIISNGSLIVKGNTTLGDATSNTITIKGKTIIEAGAGLVLKGNSSQNPLITRSIKGADTVGNVGDLYIQYGANKKIYLGNQAKYEISEDGGTYTGSATKFDGWTKSEIQSMSNTNLYSIIDTTPLLVNGINLTENCTIVTAPDNESPFKNVWLCTGHSEWHSPSDKLFYVTPGDTICVESWIMRPKDAVGDAGTYYLGIRFSDKNGVPVNGNGGTVYMDHTSNHTCPCDGKWYRIYDEYTIPKSHTPHTNSDGRTSDGGGYFTGRVRLILNYKQGTIPTYYGGFRIYRKNAATTDEITNLFNK